MKILNIEDAQKKLLSIAKNVIVLNEPVTLRSERGNIVLVSEKDYNSMLETIYLQSIPNLVKEVIEGSVESKRDMKTRNDLPW